MKKTNQTVFDELCQAVKIQGSASRRDRSPPTKITGNFSYYSRYGTLLPGVNMRSSRSTTFRKTDGVRMNAPGLCIGWSALTVSRNVLGARFRLPSLSTCGSRKPKWEALWNHLVLEWLSQNVPLAVFNGLRAKIKRCWFDG